MEHHWSLSPAVGNYMYSPPAFQGVIFTNALEQLSFSEVSYYETHSMLML